MRMCMAGCVDEYDDDAEEDFIKDMGGWFQHDTIHISTVPFWWQNIHFERTRGCELKQSFKCESLDESVAKVKIINNNYRKNKFDMDIKVMVNGVSKGETDIVVSISNRKWSCHVIVSDILPLDAGLKYDLTKKGFDLDNDGQISFSEALKVKKLYNCGLYLSKLLDYFPNVEEVVNLSGDYEYCKDHDIDIDTIKIANLQHLSYLTVLDTICGTRIENCPQLEHLALGRNAFGEGVFSEEQVREKPVYLKFIDINISEYPKLKTMSVCAKKITNPLDLSSLSDLRYLSVYSDNYDFLDLTKNTKLKHLRTNVTQIKIPEDIYNKLILLGYQDSHSYLEFHTENADIDPHLYINSEVVFE